MKHLALLLLALLSSCSTPAPDPQPTLTPYDCFHLYQQCNGSLKP